MAKAALSATALAAFASSVDAQTMTIASPSPAASPSTGTTSNATVAQLLAERCIAESTDFTPKMVNVSHTMQTSAAACQVSCALTEGCEYFSFRKDLMQCNYADAGAKPYPAWEYTSGKSVCLQGEGAPAVRCRSDHALNGFPGLTEEDSEKAWPFHKQPKSLSCWPRDGTGAFQKCKLSAVIEDTGPLADRPATNWPGLCWGLGKKNDVPASSCDSNCQDNPECPGYQITSDKCYQGLGYDCYIRQEHPDWKPDRAQRFQHGKVNVLMDLTGWQVQGLSHMFAARGDGFWKSDEEAMEGCKKVCYSDINCEYWSYSTKWGCYAEDVSRAKVDYPLTTKSANRDTPFAQTCIGGEYIQHFCEEAEDSSATVKNIPTCALSGWKLEPLDVLGIAVTSKDSAGLCQKECFNTAGCAYFSYHTKTGKCHLEPEGALMVYDKDFLSGPQDCPATTPGPQASCDLHADCVAQGFEGLCCPDPEMIIMDCCSQTAIGTNSNPNRGIAIATVTLGPADEESWLHYWWPFLAALVVVVVACIACLFFYRKSNGPKKRALETEEPEGGGDVEPLMDPYMSDMSQMSQASLPFPEAGLPSRNVPFPEAGMPVHANQSVYYS